MECRLAWVASHVLLQRSVRLRTKTKGALDLVGLVLDEVAYLRPVIDNYAFVAG